MISFTQHLKEMSLRRPDGLNDIFQQMDMFDFHNDAKKLMTPFMAKHGWKVAGTGGYGVVYTHPKYDWCLKAFSDMGYEFWIDFCQKNKGNPYLPRFKGSVITNSSGIGFIRVEKLIPCDEDTYEMLLDDIDILPHDPEFQRNNKDLWTIAKAFHTLKKTGKYNHQHMSMDLDRGHPQNVMIRNRGYHPVIIDPWTA